jgi:hypothetical protein
MGIVLGEDGSFAHERSTGKQFGEHPIVRRSSCSGASVINVDLGFKPAFHVISLIFTVICPVTEYRWIVTGLKGKATAKHFGKALCAAGMKFGHGLALAGRFKGCPVHSIIACRF